MNTQTAVEIEIGTLLPSFERSLKARRISPRTIQSYRESAIQLGDFLVLRGMPTNVGDIRREHVEAFLVFLEEDRGLKPTTLAVRYKSLRQFFAWCVEDG